MNHGYSCVVDDVVILPLRPEDSQKARVLRNNCRECFATSAEISEEQQDAWYRKYLTCDDDYMFAIWQSDSFAGQVGLYEVDASKGTCEFGRLVIDPALSGRGIGRKATEACCRIAFDDLGLDVVRLEVLDDNIAAQSIYKRVGFTVCGEIVLPDGRKELLMERRKTGK